ncbi:MAG: heavy-metal-associated domain-containing protein, partial [Armatimonadetes bacterium]|nr:heavy-metal-associated domain-containing protein [Armatimonadota bacterium]
MAGNRSTQLEPLSIPVRNMATPACAECVRRALTCVAGVEHVEVDRDGGFATVRMAPGRVATGELSDALEAAGYDVRVAVHTAPRPPDEASCQRVARALREIVGVLDVSTNGGATTTVR